MSHQDPSSTGETTVSAEDVQDIVNTHLHNLIDNLPPLRVDGAEGYDSEVEVKNLVDWFIPTYTRVRMYHPTEEKTFWRWFGNILLLWMDAPYMESTPNVHWELETRLREGARVMERDGIPQNRLSVLWQTDLDQTRHALRRQGPP
ncbi:hypothetical protein DFP72DRAFT_1081522 [Ephemerocybe angulata]|uniref:Uncharacterized protein n=1 Tax=Ephemerocybe angulata TaxID=980116 RepID=A0A8H6H8Y6_9AGAR|nr:hypothetical protein DFP72DRAFT_1081522 [Tulosesus angulatus]